MSYKSIVKALSIVLVVIIMTSILPVVTVATSKLATKPGLELLYGDIASMKISPLFKYEEYLNNPFADSGLEIINVSFGIEVLEEIKLRPNQIRCIIVASKNANILEIAKLTKGILSVVELARYKLVFAWIERDKILELARIPEVIAITPDIRIDVGVRNIVFTGESKGIEPTLEWAREIIGASRVHEMGYTGSGVTVGIVDTGVDFASPELGYDAIARDESGLPLTIDADQLGFAITNLTVTKDPKTGLLDTYNKTVYIFSPIFRALIKARIRYYWNASLIESKSGVYHFGFLQVVMFGTRYIWVFHVPILVVDTVKPGVYDTVYFDLSSTYYQLALVNKILREKGKPYEPFPEPKPEWFDLSFNDEQPVRYGREIIARDFTGDNLPDFSLGILSGYFYDVWGLVKPLTTGPFNWKAPWVDWIGTGVYRGLDVGGNYVSVFYDFHSHGTSCACVVAARGRLNYTLRNIGEVKLTGIAPKAKIAAGQALWWGDVVTAQLWLAGYNYTYPWNWTYTGKPRVDIISNSWGVSVWPFWPMMGVGFDPISAFEDMITYETGVIICHAVGNGGPGYGTVVQPGGAVYVISVGASTEFEWRPIHGYLAGRSDEVVWWSNRGPNSLGMVKPDVVNIGAFAWTATRVWARGELSWRLFGGTSEATPMTAGVIALLIEAYRDRYGVNPPPDLVKVIIKSTAKDLGYDAFTQGSGRVDAYKAVKYVVNGEGLIAYTLSTSANANLELGYKYKPLRDTTLYPGVLIPGSKYTTTYVIEGVGKVKLKPVEFVFKGEIEEKIQFPGNVSRVFRIVPKEFIKDIDLLEISLTYNYIYFDKNVDYKPDNRFIVNIYDWVNDTNGNGVPDRNEMIYVTYVAAALSNTLETYVSIPASKFTGTPVVIIYRYYGEDTVELTLELKGYVKKVWNWITVTPEELSVDGKAVFNITINVPKWATPGIRVGFVEVEYGEDVILIPVSIPIAVYKPDKDIIRIGGISEKDKMYDNYAVEGLNDWSWRYESGDWRQYPVIVEPGVVGLIVEVVYLSPLTSVDVMVINPQGFITAGVYAYFLRPSGRIPHYTPNPMERLAKRVLVPTPQPGVYRILIHNTILEGLKKPETIAITIYKIKVEPQLITLKQGQVETVKLRIKSTFTRMLVYTLRSIEYLKPGVTVLEVKPQTVTLLKPGVIEVELTLDTRNTAKGVYTILLVYRVLGVLTLGIGVGSVSLVAEPGILVIPLVINIT